MKKIKYFGLMGAIALTSAIGFTACSSDDSATADVNPTYDGTSVRTDFAFSITKASQSTRMTAENTQETGTNFRGMQHMFLLPFTGEPTSENANIKSTNSNIFALGGLTSGTSGDINPGTKHKKIYSLTFPIGTDNMLFYGTAANGNSYTNFQVGKIISTLWPDGTDLKSNQTMLPKDISFSLAPIIDTDNPFDKKSSESAEQGDATKIINYLSHIAQAKYNKGTTDTPDYVTWASTVDKSKNDGTYRALANLYNALTTKDGEARSGSTESVKRMVLDLYKSACAINHESSVTDVQKIAKAICEAIESTTDGITFSVKLSSTNNTAITIANVTDEQKKDAAGWVASISGIAENFPANTGLPMGAAQLRFNSTTGTFNFNTEDKDAPTYPGLNVGTDFTVNLSQIRYPSELIYFDNSPIRVTDKYKTEDDFPSTPTNWDKDGAGGFDADWTKNGTVASTTRAVALQNNINYGVALLESTVKLANDAATMTDNMKDILGGEATNQTDIDPTKFNITGILIGGQPATVKWNLVDESSSTFSNVIYDKEVNNYGLNLEASTPITLSTTEESAKNYTVVFDNYSGDGTQDDVLIALELVNGDKDFYGKHNLIPKGNTFYLVGKLTLSSGAYPTDPSAGWSAKHPNGYRLTKEGVARVFVQDYRTIAKIKLSKTSLQNAYSTIPDLVSTETVFGLSVDLKWEEGMQFNVDM